MIEQISWPNYFVILQVAKGNIVTVQTICLL